MFIIEASALRGVPPPKFLDDEPLLLPGDEFYMTAFYRLDTCRSIGMSYGPIPWRDIVMYADREGLDSDLVQLFVYVIRSMDGEYLRLADKKKK